MKWLYGGKKYKEENITVLMFAAAFICSEQDCGGGTDPRVRDGT